MYYQDFRTVGNVIHEWIAVEIVGNFSSNFLTKKYIIFHMYSFQNFYWDILLLKLLLLLVCVTVFVFRFTPFLSVLFLLHRKNLAL